MSDRQSFLKDFGGRSDPDLSDLPDPQRKVYAAVEINGVGITEFAEQTDQDTDTVRTQLRLAREALGREGSR